MVAALEFKQRGKSGWDFKNLRVKSTKWIIFLMILAFASVTLKSLLVLGGVLHSMVSVFYSTITWVYSMNGCLHSLPTCSQNNNIFVRVRKRTIYQTILFVGR